MIQKICMYIQNDINANPIVFIVYICASVFICLYVHNPHLRKLINKCLLLQKEKTGWAVSGQRNTKEITNYAQPYFCMNFLKHL